MTTVVTSVLIDPAEIRQALGGVGRHPAIEHQPGPDGVCPRCGEVCPTWVGAVRVLRSAGWHLAIVPPHQPDRPSWRCTPCQASWPCPQARAMLHDRYDAPHLQAELVRVMGHRMAQAGRELPDVPAAVLNARFVGWC